MSWNLRIREPDEIIGERYMRRWHLRRKHGSWNLYLHKYSGSDDDRALHDHPWKSVSILLKGDLRELTSKGLKRLLWLTPKYRSAEYSHRIVLQSDHAYTLFFTFKKEREWGFHCPKGWVHWRTFTDSTGHGIGKGCGD